MAPAHRISSGQNTEMTVSVQVPTTISSTVVQATTLSTQDPEMICLSVAKAMIRFMVTVVMIHTSSISVTEMILSPRKVLLQAPTKSFSEKV